MFQICYSKLSKERDGWYQSESFERIKNALRHKFFSLLDGIVVTDAECEAVIQDEGNAPTRGALSFRSNKHNRAKGAMPPEEAAAARLRLMLGSSSSAQRE